MRAQGLGRPHPRAQEGGRARVGAEGEDDLVGLQHERLAPRPGGLHGDGPAPAQAHAVHLHAAQEAHVRPGQGRVQVVVGRGLAAAVDHVERRRAHPARAGGVVVLAPGVPADQCRLGEALHEGEPGLARVAVDRDGAAVAVPGRLGELEVALDGAKPREEGLPAPALGVLGPLVVVLGEAAQGDRPVGHRGAPHHPPAGHVDHARGGPGLGQVPPVVGLADDPVGVGELCGPRPRAIVRPGLQEQDLAPGVLAQAGGEDAAGRAGAADEDAQGPSRRPAGRRPRPGSAP